MKIKRRILEQLVKEELAKHLKSLLEKGGEDEGDKKPGVTDADKDKKKKDKDVAPADSKPVKTQDDKKPKDAPEDDSDELPEIPAEDDPADDEIEQDVEEPEEDEEEVGKSPVTDISDELEGKSVQSITVEPKSKVVPGASEVVLTFDQITDPLRIIITKTGEVKFFFRGLHNAV